MTLVDPRLSTTQRTLAQFGLAAVPPRCATELRTGAFGFRGFKLSECAFTDCVALRVFANRASESSAMRRIKKQIQLERPTRQTELAHAFSSVLRFSMYAHGNLPNTEIAALGCGACSLPGPNCTGQPSVFFIKTLILKLRGSSGCCDLLKAKDVEYDDPKEQSAVENRSRQCQRCSLRTVVQILSEQKMCNAKGGLEHEKVQRQGKPIFSWGLLPNALCWW